MTDEQRRLIRAAVRSCYDLQQLRIENGNRLAANFRAKLGLDPNEKTEEEPEVLKELARRFRKITDGIAKITSRRKYEFDGVITDFTELRLVQSYLDLCKQEERQFRDLKYALRGVPIYDEFLSDVHGCGTAMSGVILSEMDPHKAPYVSSFWKYAGLDVASNGRGRSRREEHLIQHTYTDSEGNEKKRRGISFNPFLKTKLAGVLGTSFLRAGYHDTKFSYRKHYDDYKNRIENTPRHADWKKVEGEGPALYREEDAKALEREVDGETMLVIGEGGEVVATYEQGKTKGHRHNMAIRYMIKEFLKDLWLKWRDLEGLPVTKSYAQKKLGHSDHGTAERLGVEYDD